MKKLFALILAVTFFSGCGDEAFAAPRKLEFEKEIPRITDLARGRKKIGADDLAARAKNANNVAQLKAIVLELIELETGGK